MKEYLKEIVNLSRQKHVLDMKRGDTNFDWLLEAITDETEEVKKEIRSDNKARLEDELGDILWSWIMLVEKLRQEDFTGSHEDILARTLKKYKERIAPLEGTERDYEIWRGVKEMQKKKLDAESKKR